VFINQEPLITEAVEVSKIRKAYLDAVNKHKHVKRTGPIALSESILDAKVSVYGGLGGSTLEEFVAVTVQAVRAANNETI